MGSVKITLTNGENYKLRFTVTDSDGRRWKRSGDMLISVQPWTHKRAESRKPQGRVRYERRYENGR